MPTRTELELSIMADCTAGIQPLLDQFESESGMRVRLRLLAWDTAWSDLVRVARCGDGPDRSEVGGAWPGDAGGVGAAGGDFMTRGGRGTRCSQREARGGLRQYFARGGCQTAAGRGLAGLEPDEQSRADPGTAMTISGPWMFRALRERGLAES